MDAKNLQKSEKNRSDGKIVNWDLKLITDILPLSGEFHSFIVRGKKENDYKTLKQATGTMIPLVYVGSCNSDLIGFTYKMKKIKAVVDTT